MKILFEQEPFTPKNSVFRTPKFFAWKIKKEFIGFFLQFDASGVSMAVPSQCVHECVDMKALQKEDMTLIILGSVVAAIVLMVIICIICGVCIKRKKQQEKMRHLLSPNSESHTPTYRTMAFTENMEGTADTLEKFKRNPTHITSSPMMPMAAAYQVIDQMHSSARSKIVGALFLGQAEYFSFP